MKFTPSALLLTAGFAFSTLFSCGSAQAAVERPEETITESNPRSIYDKIWDSSTLYKADSGFLTELALQGRLHIQDAQGWSNQGNFGSRDRPQSVRWGDWEVRRLRLGAKAKLFDGNAKLDGHIDVNPNFNQFYGRIYEVFFEYTLSNALTIGFGKKKAFFSLEHSISSKEIITLERALLTNALFTGQYTGIWASGKVGIFQAGLAYDLAEATGFDRASINFDYQKATADTTVNNGNLAGAPVPYLFESAMSLNSTWEKGRWAFYTDTLAGHGRGTQGDVFGVVLMPSVYVATGLQLVSRYQYAAGQDNGLRLASRYDRLAPYTTNGGRGDVYHAFYVGANYYIYGNKLKLMTGLEYSTMSGCNYAGWTWSGGLRMFF
jgi:phosphate-selective porin OprO/OprP